MSGTILDQIVETKRSEIQRLYDGPGLSALRDQAKQVPDRPSFYDALSQPGLRLIAEVKKASPSKGIIREDFEPVSLANSFEASGASAVSVLTEIDHFLGAPEYLKSISGSVGLPCLRKDFIVDPIQVYEAKCLGASAILLIKAILTESHASELIELATSLNLDVLMEIHSEAELEAISNLNSLSIVGVNNRNLKSFEVDGALSIRLAPLIRRVFGTDTVVVAESGYSTISDLESLDEAGMDAVLIGEGLSRNPDLLKFFSAS